MLDEGHRGPVPEVEGNKAQWWLANIARSVEEALPISEQTREKIRERQTVLRVLSNCVVLLFVIWGLVGLFFLLRLASRAAGIDETNPGIGGITVRRANSLGLRAVQGWKPTNSSAEFLHGPLGRSFDGRPHEFEAHLRFPLDREVIDHRDQECRNKDFGKKFPSTSVVIIFCNEPFETLMRSVHSVFNRSPPKILREVILVDDGSDADHIKSRDEGGSGQLEDYLKLLPPKVKLIRTGRRAGIVQARLTGIRAAEGEAFVILDSHIETQPGWLEALVSPISEDPKSVVMPHIDGIDKHTYEPRKGGVGCTLGIIWKVMEHAFQPDQYSSSERRNARPSDYVSSPTMAGGLFAAHRDWFLSIGGYDEAMSGWGAENVEFSFRLWQCGGRLLCTACSRVFHMFGGGKHYTTKGHSTTANRMRTIAAWADEYADLAWHVLGTPPLSEIGDISDMLKLRRQKKCKDFKWFLQNVWPESEVQNIPEDVPFMGPIKSAGGNLCLPRVFRGERRLNLMPCGEAAGKFIYWKREGRITPETNDETCLLTTNKWDWCYYDDMRRWQLEDVTADNKQLLITQMVELGDLDLWQGQGDVRVVRIRDDKTEHCVTASPGGAEGQYILDLTPCEDEEDLSQLWLWSKYKINPVWKSLHEN